MLNANNILNPVPISGKFELPGYYIWGATIEKASDGLYHMIFSMWEEEYGFDAWITHSKFGYAVSSHSCGPFHFQGIILTGSGGEKWDADNIHNECLLYHDSKYYLYYTGTKGNGEFWDNRNHQRCGVMVADHPKGPWQRFEKPLIDVKNGNFTTGVPNVIEMLDGKFLMVYKTVLPGPLPFGGGVVHKVAISSHPLGPFSDLEKPFMQLPDDTIFPIDDHTQWLEKGKYYAIVKDNENKIYKNGIGLLLYESIDGFDWKITEDPLLLGLSLKWDDGTEENYSRLEMPKIIFDGDKIVGLSLAARPLDESKTSFNIQIPIIH